jgi:hypothetical protein
MMSSSVSVPYFAASACNRVAARQFAATCARRSPSRSVGVRTLAKMIASIAGSGLPSRYRRIGGSRRPSPYISVTAP